MDNNDTNENTPGQRQRGSFINNIITSITNSKQAAIEEFNEFFNTYIASETYKRITASRSKPVRKIKNVVSQVKRRPRVQERILTDSNRGTEVKDMEIQTDEDVSYEQKEPKPIKRRVSFATPESTILIGRPSKMNKSVPSTTKSILSPGLIPTYTESSTTHIGPISPVSIPYQLPITHPISLSPAQNACEVISSSPIQKAHELTQLAFPVTQYTHESNPSPLQTTLNTESSPIRHINEPNSPQTSANEPSLSPAQSIYEQNSSPAQYSYEQISLPAEANPESIHDPECSEPGTTPFIQQASELISSPVQSNVELTYDTGYLEPNNEHGISIPRPAFEYSPSPIQSNVELTYNTGYLKPAYELGISIPRSAFEHSSSPIQSNAELNRDPGCSEPTQEFGPLLSQSAFEHSTSPVQFNAERIHDPGSSVIQTTHELGTPLAQPPYEYNPSPEQTNFDFKYDSGYLKYGPPAVQFKFEDTYNSVYTVTQFGTSLAQPASDNSALLTDGFTYENSPSPVQHAYEANSPTPIRHVYEASPSPIQPIRQSVSQCTQSSYDFGSPTSSQPFYDPGSPLNQPSYDPGSPVIEPGTPMIQSASSPVAQYFFSPIPYVSSPIQSLNSTDSPVHRRHDSLKRTSPPRIRSGHMSPLMYSSSNTPTSFQTASPGSLKEPISLDQFIRSSPMPRQSKLKSVSKSVTPRASSVFRVSPYRICSGQLPFYKSTAYSPYYKILEEDAGGLEDPFASTPVSEGSPSSSTTTRSFRRATKRSVVDEEEERLTRLEETMMDIKSKVKEII